MARQTHPFLMNFKLRASFTWTGVRHLLNSRGGGTKIKNGDELTRQAFYLNWSCDRKEIKTGVNTYPYLDTFDIRALRSSLCICHRLHRILPLSCLTHCSVLSEQFLRIRTINYSLFPRLLHAHRIYPPLSLTVKPKRQTQSQLLRATKPTQNKP